jgi:hypothetical protein
MTKTGGALNYNERMKEIGRRALNDFLEVYPRLSAIAIGLREFYSVADLSKAEIDNEFKRSRTRIEGAVNWLRRAANALAKAKMDEEHCVIRLTIQPKAKSSLLHDLKAGVISKFSAELIKDMRAGLLRGISASAENMKRDSWMDVEIGSPEQKIGMITLPSVKVRLGRVSSSASLNTRDMEGSRLIVNRSPVGDWTLRARRDHEADATNKLHIDFHVAYFGR